MHEFLGVHHRNFWSQDFDCADLRILREVSIRAVQAGPAFFDPK